MAGEDDELFALHSPKSAPVPIESASGTVALAPQPTDIRYAGRVIGGVLLATGSYTVYEMAQANSGLAALGRPALVEGDLAPETPETLASKIPPELRRGLLHLMYALAGDEPVRRRIADAYAGLWHDGARPSAPRRTGSPIARWLIGKLPRHQTAGSQEDKVMNVNNGPYRGHDVGDQQAPPERSPLRQRVERIREEYLRVIAAVEQVIIGKRDVVERVLTAMAAKGHVLLVDVPGVGKTQLCKAIAASIESRFGRIQFTPDLLPMDVTGANVFDVRDKQFHFRPGPIFTHILLADEINRATPKTQSALLEVMEERCATVDGVTHRLEEPFCVLATMNPIDHQGTYALPAAQVDRFMIMLELGMPAPDDEVKILDYHLGAESPLANVSPVVARKSFIAWRETVPQIHVTPELKRAAVEYINGLRNTTEEGVSISPRATLAWVRASQARAMLSGREFVTMEDMLDMAPDVLRHRLNTDGMSVRERLRSVVVRSARGRL